MEALLWIIPVAGIIVAVLYFVGRKKQKDRGRSWPEPSKDTSEFENNTYRPSSYIPTRPAGGNVNVPPGQPFDASAGLSGGQAASAAPPGTLAAPVVFEVNGETIEDINLESGASVADYVAPLKIGVGQSGKIRVHIVEPPLSADRAAALKKDLGLTGGGSGKVVASGYGQGELNISIRRKYQPHLALPADEREFEAPGEDRSGLSGFRSISRSPSNWKFIVTSMETGAKAEFSIPLKAIAGAPPGALPSTERFGFRPQVTLNYKTADHRMLAALVPIEIQ